jgi:protein TonB
MFEQTFVNAQAQTKKPLSVAVSVTLQTGLLGVVLLLPLLHPGVIHPDFNIQPTLYLTKIVPPPEPPVARAVAAARPHRILGLILAPTVVPRTVDMTPEQAPEVVGPQAAGLAGLSGILTDGVTLPQQLPPPPPPVVNVKPNAPAGPIRIGGGVQAARLTFGPKPAYPPLARTARVQGTVKLQAIIARDGAIRDLQLISGPPLLVQVAIEAVRQWRYKPTLLNGEPVEVATEIDVTFTLNQ